MRRHNIVLSALLLLFVAAPSLPQVAPGTLRVGAAKVDITPAETELPKHYLGILDRVYSRAIVVDNGANSVALVTVDALLIPDPVWKRLSQSISRASGIPVKNLVITATGTHSVPRSERVDSWEDKIVESVVRAKARLQPARMNYGRGVSYINVQRDIIDPVTHRWWEGANRNGMSDKAVEVIKFASPSGDPIAVYYNYAVFNVITGTLDMVSGDVTGAASNYIEDSFDNKMVAALSAGAHGDQNPIYFKQTYDLREIRIKQYAKQGKDISTAMPPPGGTGLDRADPRVSRLMNQQKQMNLSMGQMLGEEVLHAMRTASREQSTAAIYSNQTTVSCPGRTRLNEGRGGMGGIYEDDDPIEIRLGLTMIGNVAVASVNAGIYSAIGLRMKKESPYKNTMITTAANGFSRGGYIPDDASYGHETFAVLNSKFKPGCAESAIVNGIIDMMPPPSY